MNIYIMETLQRSSKELTAIRRLSNIWKKHIPNPFGRRTKSGGVAGRISDVPCNEAEGVNNYRMDLTRLRGYWKPSGSYMDIRIWKVYSWPVTFPNNCSLNWNLIQGTVSWFVLMQRLQRRIEQIERLLFIHQMLGFKKISDTLTLQRDCLYIGGNGHPIGQIRQMKTHTFMKPIGAELELLIEKQLVHRNVWRYDLHF